jgi:hypothetical protein
MIRNVHEITCTSYSLSLRERIDDMDSSHIMVL